MWLKDWIKQANRKFKMNVPLDSDDIEWEVGPDGMRPSLTNPREGGLPSSGGGSSLWAEVEGTAGPGEPGGVYFCSVWSSRSSYYNGEDSIAGPGVYVLVPDIIDSLAEGNTFPVEVAGTIPFEDTFIDYICTEQLGVLG